MKKCHVLLIGILLLCLIATIFVGCSTENNQKLKVVTTTSLIAFQVSQLGGEKVEVINIIPPAQCPGHFDVKPGDIQKLANANLFIMHGWQGEKFSDSLISSANNSHLTAVKIDIQGNWMTPPVQSDATDKISAALCQIDAQSCATYKKSAIEYKEKVKAKSDEITGKLASANLNKINVLCDEQQAGFVKWVGFNIIETFGRPETLTPQIVKELVDKARAANVSLVIENLQSGHDSGKSIAIELNCKRITLSNFPGGFNNTETWEKAIDQNIKLIQEAIAK